MIASGDKTAADGNRSIAENVIKPVRKTIPLLLEPVVEGICLCLPLKLREQKNLLRESRSAVENTLDG